MDNPGQPAFPLPGTDEFNNLLSDIRSKPFNEDGSLVVDRSSIWHVEGMYNFTHLIKAFELVTKVLAVFSLFKFKG